MQLDITFHKPTIDDEQVLREYIQEHHNHGEFNISSSLGLAEMPFNEWLQKIRMMEAGEYDSDWGKSNLYLVCLNDTLVGLVNIRPFATKQIVNLYGHVGYGVRPSCRQQGIATEMLQKALKYCKDDGLTEVILGCVSTNIPSAKTILRCGGQLILETSNQQSNHKQIKQYYRIILKETDSTTEYWDLYDKDRNVISTDHIRGVWPIPDGHYHLVVHIWIKNSEGKYLIAQRSAKRTTNPLKWECQGGSVLKGESSLEGALREVKEEVGVTLAPSDGRIIFSRLRDVIDGKRFGDIMDVWLFNYDGQANLLDATTDEVAQVRWMSVDEIKTMYDNKELVQTLGYFFDKIASVA